MSDTKPKRRKKKEKKAKLEIHLWINCVSYEYGILCTFCTKVPAVVHCPECTDFYCEPCDVTAHNTKKRKGHIRTTMSLLDKDAAAKLVTFAVRYHGHLLRLQKKCRQVIRRYFDPKTLNHYYYNPVYGTVAWRKPYCLRKTELKPFIGPVEAAARMQGMYRCWVARCVTKEKLFDQYRKIFDRRIMQFYYAYNGKSKLLPPQSWRKPRYLGKRGFPRDIKPVFTSDVAAIRIQRMWRAELVRRFFRALVRASHDQQWDPVKGKFNYYHREKEVLYEEKPVLLGSQHWDLNYIPNWSQERVALFFRRIGLKQYLRKIHDYEVDGRTLLLLDEEDFANMEITNRVHIRKIRVEIEKIFKDKSDKIQMSEGHAVRRKRIRRAKLFKAAAETIQRAFRKHRAYNELKLRKEMKRVRLAQLEQETAIQLLGVWWTDREEIPSKSLYISDEELALRDAGKSALTLQVQSKLRPVREVEDMLKLPPLKTFGRKRDHLSCEGWGKRDGKGQWVPLPPAVQQFGGDTHATKAFTIKLSKQGYDKERLDTFKGAPIRKTFSNAAFLTKYKTDEERSVMSEDLL